MHWHIGFNPSHEVMSIETDWPEGKIEVLYHKITEIFCSLGKTYHKVQMSIQERGKHIIR